MTNEKRLEMGKRLEHTRINVLKVNKRQFSKMINIQEQNLWRILNGKVGLSIDRLIKLHDEMGISSNYILFGEGNIKGIDDIKVAITSVLADYNGNNLDIAVEIVKNILNKVN